MSVAIGNKIVAGNAGIVDAGGLVLYDRIPFTSTDNILDWAKKIQSPTIKAVTNEYPIGLPANTAGIIECYPTNDGDKILTFQTTYDSESGKSVKIYNLYINKDDETIESSSWDNSTLSEFMANIESMFEDTVSWGKGKFMTSGNTVLAWANSCTKNDSIAVVDTYFPSDLPIQLEGSLSTIVMADSDRKIVMFYIYGDGTTNNISTIYMRSIFESQWRGRWIKMAEGVAIVNPTAKAYLTATPTTDAITPTVDTNVYLGTTAGELVAKTFTGTLNGNAKTATALKSSAGSETQPIYFKDGKPVKCSFTIEVAVPADAEFTDKKVTNTLNKTTKAYITGTTSATTNTGGQVFDTGVYLSTTAGELVATKFTGALNGNANTATSQSTVVTNETITFEDTAKTKPISCKPYLRNISSGTAAATTSNCKAGALYGQYEN